MSTTVSGTQSGTELKPGRIVAIVGPVVDVEFPPGHLPELQGALEFTVEVEGETFKAKANVVEDDEEYERLYAQQAAIMPGFNEYRQKTSRKIPVIVLEPIDEAVA